MKLLTLKYMVLFELLSDFSIWQPKQAGAMLNIDLLVGIFSSGKLDTEPFGNDVENFSSLVNKKLANNGQQALIFICFKVQKRKPSSKKPIFVDWFGET